MSLALDVALIEAPGTRTPNVFAKINGEFSAMYVTNKLSYRRQTALQGALVLAK